VRSGASRERRVADAPAAARAASWRPKTTNSTSVRFMRRLAWTLAPMSTSVIDSTRNASTPQRAAAGYARAGGGAHRHLPAGGRSMLEVGGAPGQYLAYFHRRGYAVHALDYSARGCEATAENFRLLGIPGTVYHGDLFDDSLELPTFDIVYSLGLIEHFTDLNAVVERHLRFLKPGGHLLLGVPNFLGINGWFLRRLAPQLMAQHQPPAMDLDRWRAFEASLGLEVLFKGYVGGFEPTVFRRREQRTAGTAVPYGVAVVLSRLLSRRFGFLRRINGRWVSGYAMAVYRVAAPPPGS
jgi:SAM-dependent methyltransferase